MEIRSGVFSAISYSKKKKDAPAAAWGGSRSANTVDSGFIKRGGQPYGMLPGLIGMLPELIGMLPELISVHIVLCSPSPMIHPQVSSGLTRRLLSS